MRPEAQPAGLSTSVSRIFERGAGNLRIMKTKNFFSTQNQSVFELKLSVQVTKGGGACRNFAYYSMLIFGRGVHEDVLGLENTFWNPWPWPRSLRSSKIALSPAWGQHYFLTRWNFVGKRQKPRGKFANTFFVFRNRSLGLAKRASPPIEISPMTKMWQKSQLFLQFQFLFSIFRLHQ